MRSIGTMYGQTAKLSLELKSAENDTVDTMLFPDDANLDVLDTLTIHKKRRSAVSTNTHSCVYHSTLSWGYKLAYGYELA